MTDERTISRRDSLRGIVASGALIGGAGIGLGTASAGDEGLGGVGGVDQIDFQESHSVFFLFEDAEALPLNVWIRTYNADRDRIENVVKPITAAHVYTYEAKYGDYYVAEFNALQFYDRPVDSEDSVLSVTIDGETIANPNLPDDDDDDAGDGKNGKHKKGKNGDTSAHEKGDKHDETAHKKKQKKQKHKNGDKDGKDDDDDDDDDDGETATIDLDEISLEDVCVDSTFELSRFRVENENDAAVAVDYTVQLSDQEGTIGVEANSATYFEVAATTSDGQATVQLRSNDAVIDSQKSDTDVECIPRDRLSLFVDSVDADADEATFYIMNYDDVSRTAVIRVAGAAVSELVTVPANGSQYFTITAPDGAATVKLFYEGLQLDYETSGD